MTEVLDQTEHAAAELLANGFDQKFQAGGIGTQSTAPTVGGPSLQAGDGSIPHSAAVTQLSLPPINTALRPSGGSLPTQAISSPRSRNNNSLRPRGNRGGLMSPTSATAAAGTDSTSAQGIHPVVRLGWKPLCSVVCNGLRGEFLGGHDRDMFMKVTSGHYAGLPLVDVSLGGCIMTCSQFERYAGRELSKKWKESIHVVGEGEGSRATLLSWLKRKAEQDFGAEVIGKKIWVCWCADAEYYQGTIVSYNREGGKHTVQYSSRLSEDLHLAVEKISFGIEKPPLPAAAASMAMATGAGVINLAGNGDGAQQQLLQHQAQVPAVSAPAGIDTRNTNEGAVALRLPTTTGNVTGTGNNNNNNNNNNTTINFNPLWHQGSGLSVTSSYGDELRGNAALIAMAGGRSNRRASGGGGGGAVGRGRQKQPGSDAEGNNFGPSPRRARRKAAVCIQEDDITMPPPKRALSAPAAVLLAEAAAATASLAAEEQHQQQQQQNMVASPAFGYNQIERVNLPVSPLSLSMPCALMMPLPQPPLGSLTGSGSAANALSLGFNTPEALTKAVNWMHDVALCLDKDLEDTERAIKITSTPAATASFISTNMFSFISPSGRFQALVGLLRGTPACLYGVFESMVRRYNHFAGIPQLQRQKLVELMLATLVEAAAPRDVFISAPADAVAEKAAGNGEHAAACERPKTSPSPSLLNNAKNNNHNTSDTNDLFT
ncbi:hypothetical protein Ndes2526B_g09356 [Nannochloris sp. 'desiccata']|nr:hypothetical protein KSW81_003616 [Chlorella desiccata (nom. nud.)]